MPINTVVVLVLLSFHTFCHSVLSHPISVPSGNRRAGLDIFTEAVPSLEAHIRSQLVQLSQFAPLENDILLSVFVKKEVAEIVQEKFKELGLGGCLMKGPSRNMFVYEKMIEN